MYGFRLIILTRIRFRASDCGQIAKTNVVRANRNGLVRNRMRRWCSGHLCAFSRDSAVSWQVFGLRKIRPTSTTGMSGATKRRGECTSLGPGLKFPSLRSLTLVWALHVVLFSTKHIRAQQDHLLQLLLLCVLSYDNAATKDACLVCCSSWSLGPSPRRPTPSCSLAAERCGDCVRAWLYS